MARQIQKIHSLKGMKPITSKGFKTLKKGFEKEQYEKAFKTLFKGFKAMKLGGCKTDTYHFKQTNVYIRLYENTKTEKPLSVVSAWNPKTKEPVFFQSVEDWKEAFTYGRAYDKALKEPYHSDEHKAKSEARSSKKNEKKEAKAKQKSPSTKGISEAMSILSQEQKLEVVTQLLKELKGGK